MRRATITAEPKPRRSRSHEETLVQTLSSCLRVLRGCISLAVAGLGLVATASAQAPATAPAAAQPPASVESLTFQQAIDRAIANNPSAGIAAAGILRAEGLLRQAQAASLLQVNGSVQTTTLNQGVEFDGATVQPRSQITGSLTLDMPIVAAAAWARRAQARDNRNIAELSAVETRRQIALSTADAYLSILAQRRVLEGNTRARDTARAHFDLATQLEQQGTGSRLNALRAQQQVSTFERLLESSALAIYRAREALGVLVVAN